MNVNVHIRRTPLITVDTFADVANIRIDDDHSSIYIYVEDLTQADRLLDAAQQARSLLAEMVAQKFDRAAERAGELAPGWCTPAQVQRLVTVAENAAEANAEVDDVIAEEVALIEREARQVADSETCTCGHEKTAHIYHAGACRPGFVCTARCQQYAPARQVAAR